MIRFILKRERVDTPPITGAVSSVFVSHETIDIDAPELERRLTSGGFGPNGHDKTELVGVEFLPPDGGGDE